MQGSPLAVIAAANLADDLEGIAEAAAQLLHYLCMKRKVLPLFNGTTFVHPNAVHPNQDISATLVFPTFWMMVEILVQVREAVGKLVRNGKLTAGSLVAPIIRPPFRPAIQSLLCTCLTALIPLVRSPCMTLYLAPLMPTKHSARGVLVMSRREWRACCRRLVL